MRQLTPEEISILYSNLFERVFGFAPVDQIPRTVFVHENEYGEIKGFVSGYRIDKITFYMAWGGTIGPFAASRKFWNAGMQALKDSGIKWVYTNVENTNTNWQRMLMGLGWVPHGMKVTQGKLFIEYFKEL